MNDIKGQAGEIRATVTIIRKATGKVETYTLTAPVTHEQVEQLKGQSDGGHALDGSEKRSD